MKRIMLLVWVLLLLPVLAALGDDSRDNGHSNKEAFGGGKSNPVKANNGKSSVARTVPGFRQPVIINMTHSSSGGHNRNYPAQQSYPAITHQPSYQRIQRSAPGTSALIHRPDVKAYAAPGIHAAVSVHHHPYTTGYVRKKLQNIGVTREPSYITDRSEIIHTDRIHSTIVFPRMGPDHRSVAEVAYSSRHFNDPVIRDHMAMVDEPEWHARIDGFNREEFERGRYYWHRGEDFNYCHYIDGSGYHWWGWYRDGHYFWNRYFGGRWWWYDNDFDRWCFWNEGFWWWQDPYHVGDLYCYNNDTYIPSNSAEDQVVVQSPDAANFQTYTSPDGTRQVKVATDSQDAFLYDTADPPSFNPFYLASGVQSVQFSDTSSGRPLQIVLRLNDGTFDVLDGQGVPYSPGVSDDGQNDPQGGDYSQPPSDPNNP